MNIASSIEVADMSSLSLFYRDVKRVERLSREEEVALARKWHDGQDREAAQQLVVANLYGVAAIAREYRHFGLQEADLIQEGTLGLMHAVKRFDPERGFRLMTYASWWIRAAIHDFILHSWSIVKLGTNKLQRKIFAGLQKAKNAIAALMVIRPMKWLLNMAFPHISIRRRQMHICSAISHLMPK